MIAQPNADEPQKAPLDEVMLAMDVVDTLRHRQDLVARELDGEGKEARLIDRLRDLYHGQGIEVPDHILQEGVAALEQSRFTYAAPEPSLRRTMAQFYVSRGAWGNWVLGVGVALALVVGAYFYAYLPYQSAQIEASRVELAETMPATMQSLYDTIVEETKVQSVLPSAQTYLAQGQTAVAENNRVGAQAAIERLTQLRDTLRQEYILRVVNREGVRSGFWTFPEVNDGATNYYIVVEALNDNAEALTLPILNEETGTTEEVAMWGLRVAESVYNSVSADKLDDGIIQRNIAGRKQLGFVEVKYNVQALGGAVTQW